MMSNKTDPPAYVGYPGPSGVWSDQAAPPTGAGAINSSHNNEFRSGDTEAIISSGDAFEQRSSGRHQVDDVWNSRNTVFKTMDFKQPDFDDIMKQPTSPLTIPGINAFFSLIFTYSQAVLYTVLTLVTGIFITIGWGLVFAVISYVNIWLLKPALRLTIDLLTPFGQFYRFILRMFLDPVFEAIGQVNAYIRGDFKLNVTGIPRERRTVVQDV